MNSGMNATSPATSITDEEFNRGCQMIVENLTRAAALRERMACAAIARTAYEAWQADPDCEIDSDTRACDDIARRIEARQ
jgi:hypothetical protein